MVSIFLLLQINYEGIQLIAQTFTGVEQMQKISNNSPLITEYFLHLEH